MPDGEFSLGSEEDVEDRDNFINEHSSIEDVDDDDASESADDERRRMLEAGVEPCPHREGFMIATGDGGSTDRQRALREPTTRADPREEFIERSLGGTKVALLRELGVYDDLIHAMPQFPSCNILTSEEDLAVMAMEDFVETDLLLTLDSGCCDQILDMADARGYACVLHPSAGSQRGQKFVVGSGERVSNRGQIKLRMKSKDESGFLMNSVFQVAEITRPLMSVSRICDQDVVCVFEKDHARVLDPNGNVVARFERDGGLYTCTMKLRRPEARNSEDFPRPERSST
jgi:hypothetical protein